MSGSYSAKDFLFTAKGELSKYLRQWQETAAARAQMSAGDFATHSDEELAERLIASTKLEPIILKLDESKPIETPRAEAAVTFRIPFTGTPHLWHLRPSQYTQHVPMGEMGGYPKHDAVLIRINTVGTILQPAKTSDEIKAELRQRVTEIQQWLGWVNGEVEAATKNLKPALLQALAARRAELGTRKQLMDDLQNPLA